MKKSILYHIGGWVAFAGYEIISLLMVTGTVGHFESYLLHYLINILLFYTHAGIVLKYSFSTKKTEHRFLILPLLALELSIYLLMSYFADYLLGSRVSAYFGKSGMHWPFIFSSAWRAIYFIGFATTYYMFLRFHKSKEKQTVLEKLAAEQKLKEKQTALELSDSKNAHLRAQVNPHFLMNTLTFIYNKTHQSEPHTSQAVFYLSKVLRYIIDADHGPGFVMLGQEIEQVDNLFQLCRIKDEEVYVDIIYPEELEEIMVIPLVLLSLAENMVKHGNLSEAAHPGTITISREGSMVVIETKNMENTGINDTGNHSGLKNIRQRLAYTYKGLGGIEYFSNQERQFTTTVSIPLNY